MPATAVDPVLFAVQMPTPSEWGRRWTADAMPLQLLPWRRRIEQIVLRMGLLLAVDLLLDILVGPRIHRRGYV